MEPEIKNETQTESQMAQKIEKKKYNITSSGFRQKIEQNLDNNSNLITKMKNEILSQGNNILFDIQKTLNKFDVDNSGRIDIDEFNRLCSEHNINLIPDEIKTVFTCFDPNRIGKIYYKDFLSIIHGELNDFRTGLVDQLFNQLNKDNKETIEMKAIFSSFNEKRMGPESTDEFKDNFAIHHEFFEKGKKDVNYNEFLNFFEVLSLNFKEDSEFEKYMKNAFGLHTGNEEEIDKDEQEIKKKMMKK